MQTDFNQLINETFSDKFSHPDKKVITSLINSIHDSIRLNLDSDEAFEKTVPIMQQFSCVESSYRIGKLVSYSFPILLEAFTILNNRLPKVPNFISYANNVCKEFTSYNISSERGKDENGKTSLAFCMGLVEEKESSYLQSKPVNIDPENYKLLLKSKYNDGTKISGYRATQLLRLILKGCADYHCTTLLKTINSDDEEYVCTNYIVPLNETQSAMYTILFDPNVYKLEPIVRK